MKGLGWAAGSVVLVSIAQLVLRQAMLQITDSGLVFARGGGLLLLGAGLFCYLASMGCWFMALRRMALSKAYSVLSLSYGLVWGAAIVLPGWQEQFHWSGALGVLLIVAGVLVIFAPRRAD